MRGCAHGSPATTFLGRLVLSQLVSASVQRASSSHRAVTHTLLRILRVCLEKQIASALRIPCSLSLTEQDDAVSDICPSLAHELSCYMVSPTFDAAILASPTSGAPIVL